MKSTQLMLLKNIFGRAPGIKTFYNQQCFLLRKDNNTSACSFSKKATPDVQRSEEDKLFSKLEIELRGVDPAVLKSYAWFAKTAANQLGIEVGNSWAARKAHHDRLTLLKCVHIYKKHRVQYEVRTYFRYMHFHKLTGSTLDTFLEYIERNLPEGVLLEARKNEIQKIPGHLEKPPKVETPKLQVG